jgi:succinate dehydrogenase/fumarate reductase flavoprotein subunit
MTRFDYVIVGAGPAGCVLANRLCADPTVTVLLIEAGGPDTSPLIAMPRGFAELLGDPTTAWHYPTRPFGPSQQVEYWVRGKTLGGSSSVNGMVYNRGNRADYDTLERLGNPGWGWDEVEHRRYPGVGPALADRHRHLVSRLFSSARRSRAVPRRRSPPGSVTRAIRRWVTAGDRTGSPRTTRRIAVTISIGGCP